MSPSPNSTPKASSKTRSGPANIPELMSSIKSNMETDRSGIDREITQVVEGLKELNSQAEGLRSYEMAAKYQAIVQKCEKMEVEKLELEDKYKMLVSDTDIMKGKLVMLKDDNTRLLDQVYSFQASERNTEAVYKKLRAEFEDSQKKQRQITAKSFDRNQSLAMEKGKIEDELKGLRGELEGEKGRVKEKEGDIMELLKKNKALELQNGMIMEDLKMKVKEKEEEVHELSNRYKALEKENQGLELVKVKMEGQLKGLGEELEGEKQQVKEKEREITDLLKKNESLDMNNRMIEADFKRKLKEKEDEVEGLTNKYRSLEMEKHNIEKDKGEIKDQLKILGVKLEEEKQHAKEKEREINELVEKNHALEMNTKRIEDDLKSKLKENEEEIEIILKKNKCLEMEKGKIDGELKDFRNKAEEEQLRAKENEVEITELVRKNEALEMSKKMMEEDLKRKVKRKRRRQEPY